MKYEILATDSKTIEADTGETFVVYRIKSLVDIERVGPTGFFDGTYIAKKGELGGYVASEKNLSQYDKCWIDQESIVVEDACICENAVIYDSSIRGNEFIGGNKVIANRQD